MNKVRSKNETVPILQDSFGFFESTKIRLVSQNKRAQRDDLDHLTDEKHIRI
jgi:hypothetical protein